MPAPFANSYWVIEHLLLAGEYPGSPDEAARTKIHQLLDAGIRHFLDLTQAGELLPYEEVLMAEAATRGIDVTYTRRPIPDMNVTSESEMRAILDDIDAAT